MEKKCKIAILDSGCNEYQMKSTRIIRQKNFISEDKLCIDDNGHGTAVLDIINKLQPNAEFIILKVLDNNAESKLTIINESLKYLLGIKVDYICMSFSTDLEWKKEAMYFLCEKLRMQGKVLVASKANSGARSYPAEFDNVIGVEGVVMESAEEFWYAPEKKIQVVANVLPVMVPTKNGTRGIMFGGNSKAAAFICGLLARESLGAEEYLLSKRSRREWEAEEVRTLKRYRVKADKNQTYSDRLFGQVCFVLEQKRRGLSRETDLHIFLSPEDYYEILAQIKLLSGYWINCFDMRYQDFDTAGALYKRILEIKLGI